MQPPPSPIEPTGTFSGIRPAAVFAGAVADLASTFVALMLLMLVFTGSDTSKEALEALNTDSVFATAALAVGLACTAFGGFYAGRRAGVLQTRHGALVGLVAIVLALSTLLLVPGESNGPLWLDVLGALLSVPAGMLGGYVAERLGEEPV